MRDNLRVESKTMFEPWQIGQDYHTWFALGKPGRFGAWFLDYHGIEGHIKLFNERDTETAKEYIMKMTK